MKVGVSGASGRMGGLAAKTFAEADDLHLIALYDRHTAGNIAGLSISQDPAVLDGCDVILEFSPPASVMDHLANWRQFGANVVVGTSGFDAEKLATLEELWGNGPGNCLVVPNFSIGGVLLMKMAEMAAQYFDVAEVIEMHHDRKIDAPSGTAVATAERIAEFGGAQERAMESEEFHTGARGATIDGVSVHSVRMPGLLAHQLVMFGSDGETLSLRHDTMDRAAFLPGILLAVRSVSAQKAPLAVGLEALLGI
ncbi:MAG: 4-hydroxy-tetrahydrodipicolinate reductase [Armatimonadetes bacterium]|nr:MAG: 4-hydroxy-tetrahydrodipicolinate reductase [Armatimonadota bacterium]